MPDYRIPLTEQGVAEAREAGRLVREQLAGEHGLTMRLFCMRWFHWTVEYFESLNNPENAGIRTLVRQPDGRYQLDRPFTQWAERAETDTVLSTLSQRSSARVRPRAIRRK